ncbi:helix-turn-helix domain-containing protein [Vibrio panuliri]|uniref:Transcriptional regulator n=1 Tax=Vibrio panuliri TaxID=1381081 RepID=A0A1Q9HQI6_9VIBR|nr:helix-turn-helix transcriptional regulator [Vibrio panuliri]KAB1457977.1 helix-turn-helix transcriptional regulator [Vibrio panuliri]OLQ93096.1 transcriptional regulator [Vibrio panuliri]OLQ96587.1 transcriptional regulator [Vibrio panuliri]
MQENYQDRIIALLKEKGETNASLAIGIHKGKATVGRYLSKSSNRTYPSIEEISEIAAYLGVQPHWLAFGIGDKYTDDATINKMSTSGAVTVNVYSRADVAKFIETGEAPIVTQMPVHKEFGDCFGVVYPAQGSISHTWDCAALILQDKNWVNDDIVLARIGNNPTPDFFTLVKVSDTIHVWYGEDTTKNPIHSITEDEIEVLGIVCWGTWAKRR